MTAPVQPTVDPEAERIRKARLWESMVRAGVPKDMATQFVSVSQPSGQGPNPEAGSQADVGGLAKRAGLQNLSGLLNMVAPAELVDMSGQPPGNPGSAGGAVSDIADQAYQPGTGDKALAGPLAATPQPQGTLQQALVGAGSQVLPGLLAGPAGVAPAMVAGGTAGALQNSTLPEVAKVLLPLLAGGAAGAAQSALRSGTAEGGAARVMGKVAKQEPVAPTDLVKAGEPGMETLASRVDQPLAAALKVPATDARATLQQIETQIKSVNAEYPKIMGPPDAPTMVAVSPRLRTVLENPDVRAAIEAQRSEINASLLEPNPTTGVRAPHPPFPDLYDRAGNLVATEVPLKLLDQAKQGFDAVVAKSPTGQSIQRTARKFTSDKVSELRTATDAQLAAQGHTDYVQVRAERAGLEGQRAALADGLNLFKATEKDSRGGAVPQTPSSIKAKIAALPPAEQDAFRQGVFTAARERLTNQGLNPSVLNRLRLALPDGANMNAVVKAIRAGQTQQGIITAAGAKNPGTAGSQAALGTVEAALGMKNASAWHFVRSLFARGVPPEAQAIIQQYLVSPEGATVLQRALQQRSAAPIQAGVGTAIGAQPQ